MVVVVDGDRRASYEWETNADPNGSGVDVNLSEDEIQVGQIAA